MYKNLIKILEKKIKINEVTVEDDPLKYYTTIVAGYYVLKLDELIK